MVKYRELKYNLFELLEDYSEDGIFIAKGFIWDGASVPWYLRWLTKPTKKTKEASMVHDMLYSMGNGVARETADKVFKRKLLEDNVSKVKATVWHWTVRAFGWLYYKGN